MCRVTLASAGRSRLPTVTLVSQSSSGRSACQTIRDPHSGQNPVLFFSHLTYLFLFFSRLPWLEDTKYFGSFFLADR